MEEDFLISHHLNRWKKNEIGAAKKKTEK